MSDVKVYNYIDVSVHHIIKVKDDEDLIFESSNLITLCRYHHELVENNERYISVLREIVKEQESKEGI